MVNLTRISKMSDRGEDLYSNHRLMIAGEDWSHRLISASVTYSADAGGSGLEFSVTGSLDAYQDAPITLWLGYGEHLIPYFRGRIMAPKDDDVLFHSSATAFGPFRLMVDQVLGTNEIFIGKKLEWVILECARRAGYAAGKVVVINGHKFTVPQGEQFPFDTPLSDVVNTLMEKADFVGMDMPGGRRLFMPRPRPGTTTDFKATYAPNQYIEFNVEPYNEASYSRVVVYRNGENGKPVVWATRDVGEFKRFPAARRRWYVIADFPGNQMQAGNEAYNTALLLRNKHKKFSLKTMFTPDLVLFDGIRVSRTQQTFRDRTIRRIYSCQIDDSISVEYSPGTPLIMTVSGNAFEIEREMLEVREAPIRMATSPGVVRSGKLDDDISMDNEFIAIEDRIVTPLYPSDELFPHDTLYPDG